MRHSQLHSALLSAAVLATVGGFAQWASAAVKTPDHVVVLIEENHDADQILGNANAPYLNSLFKSGLYFTNAHGTDHDSQPNYLELFSGDNPGLKGYNSQGAGADSDGYGGAVQQRYPTNVTANAVTKGDNISDNPNLVGANAGGFTTPNLGAALISAGKTFVNYSEGLDPANPLAIQTNGSNGNRAYVQKHNAPAQWVGNGPNQLPASVNESLTPFTTISNTSNFAALPNVSFVVPNEYNDMHDTVSVNGLYATAISKNTANPVDALGAPVNGDSTIQNGDNWAQANIAAYANWAATHNSLLITLWDENDYDLTNLNDISVSINGDASLVQAGTYSQYINHFDILNYLESANGASLSGLAATADGLPTDGNGVLVGDGAPLPEPASMALLAGGLVALTARRRSR